MRRWGWQFGCDDVCVVGFSWVSWGHDMSATGPCGHDIGTVGSDMGGVGSCVGVIGL